MKRGRIAGLMVVLVLAGCVAQEFTLPTQLALPTLTVTPLPIAAVITEPPAAANAPSLTPAGLPIGEPAPSSVPPAASPLLTPEPFPSAVPEALSRALANPAVTPFRPLAALAPIGVPPTATLIPTLGFDPAALPTAIIVQPTAPAFVTVAPLIAAAPTGFAAPELITRGDLPAPLPAELSGDLEAMRRFLRALPTFSGFDTPQVRAIAASGSANGARGQVFTTVGDSNSVSGDFLRPLVLDNYCRWGAYSPLQETVRHYSVPPDAIAASSFTHESIAVQMGFNSAAARDPFWATDPRCVGGESPFTCELRVTQPGVVIFMLGNKDVSRLSADAYRANMEALVDEAMARGVIPVLTTFVVLPERDVYAASLVFNMILVEIARARGVPIINLWGAAEALPDHGIAADRTHLRTDPGDFCDFTGGERVYGGTLRNLLTLAALEEVRRGMS